MRNIVFAFVALLASGSVACTSSASVATDEPALETAWQPLLRCNGAVLDVNGAERRNIQLVIRDGNAVRELNRVGAVQSAFGATEIVLSGWTGNVDWSHRLGPRLNAQPYGGPGVFEPDQFQEMIADHNTYEGGFGRFVRVARDSGGIKVQFGTIEKRGCAEEQTTYVGDGFGWVTSCVADYSAFVEKANWFFPSCD